jgi:hypothetical protein
LNIGVTGKGNLTVADQGLVVAGGIIHIGANGTVTADGGTLKGNIINGGTLDVSSASGITGKYTQSSTGILSFDAEGLSDYGSLAVSGSPGPGTITFDSGSSIDVDFIDGYTPQIGDVFDLITTTGGITDGGVIGHGVGTTGNNISFSINLVGGDDLDITITDIPEPGTWVLLVTALFAIAVFAGHRKRVVLPDLAI